MKKLYHKYAIVARKIPRVYRVYSIKATSFTAALAILSTRHDVNESQVMTIERGELIEN